MTKNSGALLVTFPDYPVNTDTFYGYTSLVGHAGVLLIRHDGFTRYFEFGRYPPEVLKGKVRSHKISNATIAADGRASKESLKKILLELSEVSGKKGRVRAAYFINVDFDRMLTKAQDLQPTYEPALFNCGLYAESVILEGNAKIDRPAILVPVPNNIVDEYIEEKNAEVRFSPETNELFLGEGDEADAKVP